MAKRGDGYPKAIGTAKRKTVTHRVNRHTSNGAHSESAEVLPEKVPIGEAMRKAVEALGDVEIDSALAPTQMLELAECYDQVVRMQAAFDARSEDAKTAKKSLDSAQNLLLDRVKQFTHPAPLPLFDGPQREKDHDKMLDSAKA